MNPPQNSSNRISLAEIIGAVLVLSFLGWFLIWPAFQNVRDSFTVDAWPTTRGTVTKSRRSQSSNGSGRTSISYRFRYEYEVDRQTYTGWRYSLSVPSGSQRAGVQTHHEGETVIVHYDPNSPSRSVIDTKAGTWWNYLVLGFIFFLGIVAILVKLPKPIRTTERENDTKEPDRSTPLDS